MKKQFLFILICFGLIMPGSSFISGLNAQTELKSGARATSSPKTTQKPLTELKKLYLEKIANLRKDGKRVTGDPCETEVPITLRSRREHFRRI